MQQFATWKTNNKFEYQGQVYVKPSGRGIRLGDTGNFLDDEIGNLVEPAVGHGWSGTLRIVVERLEDAPRLVDRKLRTA